MQERRKERLDYLDIIRGIGIILVVWGHCPGCPVIEYIYSFHMPLFIFMAGFLHINNLNISQYVSKQIARLLVPFFFFSMVSWLIYFLISLFFYQTKIILQISKLKYILLGSGQNATDVFGLGNIVLWFLPCLFCVSVIYYVLLNTIKNDFFLFVTGCLISVLGYICSRWHINLPYSLDSAFIVFPFYYLGNKFCFWISKLENIDYPYYLTGILILAGLHFLIFTVNAKLNGGVDTSSGNTGNYFLFYLAAVLAILYVFMIGLKLKKVTFLNYLGQKSLIILVVHLPAIQLLVWLFKGLGFERGIFSIIVTLIVILLCQPLILISETRFGFAIGKFSPEKIQRLYSAIFKILITKHFILSKNEKNLK